MRQLRAILTVLLMLVFVVSTNCCTIASVLPEVADDCCAGEGLADEANPNSPAGQGNCASCRTLDTGINLSVLVPLVAVAPVWGNHDAFAELLQKLAAAEQAAVAPTRPDSTTDLSPPWCDVIKKAQPVRGPSFTA